MTKTLKRKRKTAADIPVTGDDPDDQEMELAGESQVSDTPFDIDSNIEVQPNDETTTEEADNEIRPVVECGTGTPEDSESMQIEDANAETAKDLERHELWKAEIRRRNQVLEDLKDQRKELTSEIKDAEKELKKAILIGPEGMFNRPLFDMAERDQIDGSEIWRQTPISELDLPEKLKDKTANHFPNVGKLVDWMNMVHREKKEGLGAKAIEKLQDAVNKIHEPIIQQQLADAQESESIENIPAIEVPSEPEWQEYTKIMVEMFNEEKYDFACETIGGIYDWVIENQHITEEQIIAIQNIKESVE